MEIIKNITTVLSLIGVGTLVGVFAKHFLNIQKEKRLQNQKLKEDWYSNLIKYMRSYLSPESVSRGYFHFADKSVVNLSGELLKTRLMENIKEIYYEILLYASDDVILSIKSFIKNPSEQSWLDTIISMRKDLWNKTKLKINNIEL